MEPLRPSYVDLVKPHLPDTWMGGKEIFLKMIDAASFPGFRNRFWRYCYEKDQSGKWIVPGFSGTIQEDTNLRRLVVIDPHAPLIARTKDKKVKEGVEIITFRKGSGWDTALKVNTVAYKKKTLKCDQNKKLNLYILNTIQEHESLAEGCPQGIAAPPTFLSTYYNPKKDRHFLDFAEKRAFGTLSKEFSFNSLNGRQANLSLFHVAYGFNEIAKALLHINRRGKVHADVKCENILVTLDGDKIHFGLTDFELLSLQGQWFSNDPPCDYAFWDQVRGKFKIATPFCDIYGFAQSLGMILFGTPYSMIIKSRETKDLDQMFESYKENLKGPTPEIQYTFCLKAYHFIRQVKLMDNLRAAFLTGKENQFLDLYARISLIIQLPAIKIEECEALTVELIKILGTKHGSS